MKALRVSDALTALLLTVLLLLPLPVLSLSPPGGVVPIDWSSLRPCLTGSVVLASAASLSVPLINLPRNSSLPSKLLDQGNPVEIRLLGTQPAPSPSLFAVSPRGLRSALGT